VVQASSLRFGAELSGKMPAPQGGRTLLRFLLTFGFVDATLLMQW